jgi:hypothetical protein
LKHDVCDDDLEKCAVVIRKKILTWRACSFFKGWMRANLILFFLLLLLLLMVLLSRFRFIYLLKNNFFKKINFRKVNFRKVNYFLIFSSEIKNKLKNIFQCLVMSWKISCKIIYYCFIFFKFIKIMRKKSYKLKS